MRKALNENPMVQLGVLGVGLLILGFMLFSTVLGGDEASPESETSSEPATTAVADPATTATAAEPVPAPATGAPAVPGGTQTAPAGALRPSRGLPDDVVRAYADNRPIALLVIDPRAEADAQVEEWTRILDARRGLESFIVKVKDIADYARITRGVGVTRTPALVMVSPRKLTDNVPTATVSTGFEGPRSLEQTLDDALYEGNERLPSEAYP